jgi:hypothetical protein
MMLPHLEDQPVSRHHTAEADMARPCAESAQLHSTLLLHLLLLL